MDAEKNTNSSSNGESPDEAGMVIPGTSGQDSGARSRQLSESSDKNETKRQRTISQTLMHGVTDASPPKFITLEEIMSAAKSMSDMALAHEIAVDSNFELKKFEPPENSLHKKVKETMHKVFWDILRQELNEDPPQFAQACVLLLEIRDNLLALLMPRQVKLKEEISEVLDIELIKQQAENNILDFKYIANYIISMMAKLCSPVRDESIQKLNEEADIVDLFKGILENLQLMKLDMANFTIGMYRPYLVATSVEYEKEKFKQYLKVNPDGLDVTTDWLSRHITPTTPLTSMDDKRAVIAQAYLELLTWNDENEFPETLMMDKVRFLKLRSEFMSLTITATVLLLMVSNVPQLQGNSQFKADLKKHLTLLLAEAATDKDAESLLPNVTIQATQDCNAALPQPLPEEAKKQLEMQIMQVMTSDHRIRQLVSQRISEFLLSTITSTSSIPLKIPPGLSSLQEELSSLAAKYHRLVSYNRDVFGEFYTDILESARLKQQ